MEIAERYVRLAHGINALEPGFIDSYIGPPEWSAAIDPDPARLEVECEALLSAIANLEDASRRAFLEVQLRAMRTVLRSKRGEKLPFAEEVLGLYDIEPVHVQERIFEEAQAVLETMLPGSGPLMERWAATREPFRVPLERLGVVLEGINTELRGRTQRLFALPEHESIELVFVQNKPWSGYNWYLGQGKSRVEINTDLPSYLYDLPDLIAHEGYPGHHTERLFKDQLYRTRGYAEFSLQLLNSPEAVLSEGIATNALEVILAAEEFPEWLLELSKRAALTVTLEDIHAMHKINQAFKALGDVGRNTALLVHQQGASDTEALEYLMRYGLATPERAKKRLEFIHQHRGYIFTYSAGYRLVRDALNAAEPLEVFKRLLAEPVTPGQLRQMATG